MMKIIIALGFDIINKNIWSNNKMKEKIINKPSIKYDNNGNVVHYKDSNGDERWLDYDKNNNPIHYKNSTGSESWCEYDENGNLIHYKNSDGLEYWKRYDENNHCIGVRCNK